MKKNLIALSLASLAFVFGSAVQATTVSCITSYSIYKDNGKQNSIVDHDKLTVVKAEYYQHESGPTIINPVASAEGGFTVEIPSELNSNGFPIVSKIVLSSAAGIEFNIQYQTEDDAFFVDTIAKNYKSKSLSYGILQLNTTIGNKNSYVICKLK